MTAAPAPAPPASPPAASPEPPRWRAGLAAWWPVLAVAPLFLLFLIFKVYGTWGAWSDENIYFYMSVRTAFDGLWPYKDYFFAHPPLHIFLCVIVFKAAAIVYGILHGSMAAGVHAMTDPENWAEGGFALSVAKWIPMASGAVASLFVYKAARCAGKIEGLIGAACFLMAHGVLLPTSYFTGVAEAAMFAAIGIDRVLERKDRQAGLAFAAGCLVAMYVAPTGVAVWLVLLLISRRRALSLAVWTGVPLLVVHGFFLAWAGTTYWDQTFLYHLKKPEMEGTFMENFWRLMYHDSHLFYAAPTAVVVAVVDAMGLLGLARKPGVPAAPPKRSPSEEVLADLFSLARLREDQRRQVLVLTFFGFCFQVVFIFQTVFIYFYFVMAFVSAGVLGGYAYGGLLRSGWQLACALVKRENAAPRAAAFVAIAIVASLGELVGRSDAARRSEVPDKYLGRPVRQYWREAPRMGALNWLLRKTVWDDTQILGEHYTAMTYYMWYESRVFEVPTAAAAYIKATTPPDAKIFGDSTSVPLAALRASRRLVYDEADTNIMRFSSNITPAWPFIDKLRKDPPLVILARRGHGFFVLPGFQQWVQQDYDLVQTINDKNYGEYYLFRRKGA